MKCVTQDASSYLTKTSGNNSTWYCVTQDASNCFTKNVKSFTGITNYNFQLTVSNRTLYDYKASRVIITTNLYLKVEIRISISQFYNSELNTVFSRNIRLCDVTSCCYHKFHKVSNSMQNVLQSHYSCHFRCSKLLKNTSDTIPTKLHRSGY